jgi:hypothetical protein
VPESYQSDAQKLRQLEAALERCERFGLANRYVSAIIHEVNNPLEAITTLVYLTKTQKENPALVDENMETIEQQLALLSKVTSQALRALCRSKIVASAAKSQDPYPYLCQSWWSKRIAAARKTPPDPLRYSTPGRIPSREWFHGRRDLSVSVLALSQYRTTKRRGIRAARCHLS